MGRNPLSTTFPMGFDGLDTWQGAIHISMKCFSTLILRFVSQDNYTTDIIIRKFILFYLPKNALILSHNESETVGQGGQTGQGNCA